MKTEDGFGSPAPSNHVASTSPESSPEIQRDEEENVKPKTELTSPTFVVPDSVPHVPDQQPVSSFSAPDLVGSSAIPDVFGSVPDYSSAMPASITFQDFREPPYYARSIASTSYAPSISAYTESVDTTPSAFASHLGGLSNTTFAQEALKVNNELNALFSAEFFDKFFHDLEDSPSAATSQGMLPLPAADTYHYSYDAASHFPFPTDPIQEAQPFMCSVPPLDADFIEELMQPPPDLLLQQPWMGPSNIIHPPPVAPYPSEYQQYMHLFYQMFLVQMPVMHISTFTIEGKPQILLSAMQACGALYVKTTAAGHFIDDTLQSSREQLVTEFAKETTDAAHHVHLVLAVVLLQTIGLFHQRPEQRTYSSFYHGMLVMMIRQAGLIQKVTQWTPPVIHAGMNVVAAWRDWAFHETTKRALHLTYLHDCCHCIYFTLRPNFARDEVTVPLPCADDLWDASTPKEWYSALQKQSRYGTHLQRFRPPGLQEALAFLAEQREDEANEAPLLVTPFAHFVLSHAILRKLFDDCIAKPADSTDEPTEASLSVQYMLHKWLQSWLHSPDTPQYTDDAEPRFLFDALPFYWIAQVALLAFQERLPPFATSTKAGSATALGEAKFRLLKEWLRHIRQFLRKGEQGPTLFWDELTKIRMKSSGRGAFSDTESLGTVSDDSDGPGGLLGFFAGES